jgi:hypothetical protein
MNPSLPDFAYRATGYPSDGYVLGVSDNIKPNFRKYTEFHEFYEFTQLEIGTNNRCVTALEKEVSLVPEEFKPKYLLMRKNFFVNLIPYCELHQDSFTQDDISEIQNSHTKLVELLRQYPTATA